MTKIFTKESLVKELWDISKMGWVKNRRKGNTGGVGNTLEDLLGIQENNLPVPNAAEWELKTTETGDRSLLTLFHLEPSPQGLAFIVTAGCPKYGWPHSQAGKKYPDTEMSFRQTINTLRYSPRGFKVILDRTASKVMISFDCDAVTSPHNAWRDTVAQRAGLGELSPTPYWGLTDLMHKAGDKLHNCFFVRAKMKKIEGEKYFNYYRITILQGFDFDRFLQLMDEGDLYVDFDARTGHNHGTKFRVRQGRFHKMFRTVIEVTSPDVDLSPLESNSVARSSPYGSLS